MNQGERSSKVKMNNVYRKAKFGLKKSKYQSFAVG